MPLPMQIPPIASEQTNMWDAGEDGIYGAEAFM